MKLILIIITKGKTILSIFLSLPLNAVFFPYWLFHNTSTSSSNNNNYNNPSPRPSLCPSPYDGSQDSYSSHEENQNNNPSPQPSSYSPPHSDPNYPPPPHHFSPPPPSSSSSSPDIGSYSLLVALCVGVCIGLVLSVSFLYFLSSSLILLPLFILSSSSLLFI